MISVTSDMVLSAVVFSLLFGVLGGVTYSIAFHVISTIRRLLLKAINLKKATSNRMKCSFANVFDFLFAMLIGIGYYLILYVCTDGVFNLCSLLTLLVGFLGSKKTINVLITLTKKTKMAKYVQFADN